MRKLLGIGCVLLVVVGLAVAGRLWSQDRMPHVAPESRVGLINLNYVVTNYNKYKTFKADVETQVKAYQDRLKDLQGQAAELKKAYDATDPLADRRAEIETAMKQLQSDIQKTSEDAKKELGDKTSLQMVIVYKDVRSACERYAKTHDLELVMHYNEPPAEVEIDGVPNVERKMGAGACIPLYMAPGVEISKEVVEILNESK